MESKEMNNHLIPSNLYVLKHKDLDVAMVQIDMTSGKIEYVLAVYLPEELPVGDIWKMAEILWTGGNPELFRIHAEESNKF